MRFLRIISESDSFFTFLTSRNIENYFLARLCAIRSSFNHIFKILHSVVWRLLTLKSDFIKCIYTHIVYYFISIIVCYSIIIIVYYYHTNVAHVLCKKPWYNTTEP